MKLDCEDAAKEVDVRFEYFKIRCVTLVFLINHSTYDDILARTRCTQHHPSLNVHIRPSIFRLPTRLQYMVAPAPSSVAGISEYVLS